MGMKIASRSSPHQGCGEHKQHLEELKFSGKGLL